MSYGQHRRNITALNYGLRISNMLNRNLRDETMNNRIA